MLNTVITGASRGIGLELVNWALTHDQKVLAIARKPQDSTELMQLKEKFKDRLEVFAADLEDNSSFEKIQNSLKNWAHIDVLINNAGVLERGEGVEDFHKSFQINTIAPFLVIKALMPKLKAGKNPKTIQISSMMGSIADNHAGGDYTYRSSKAALNMIIKSLSVDEPWLTSIVMHPGWVQTRMGGSAAPTPVTESAQGIWNVINAVTRKDSGSFIDYKGKHLPW